MGKFKYVKYLNELWINQSEELKNWLQRRGVGAGGVGGSRCVLCGQEINGRWGL